LPSSHAKRNGTHLDDLLDDNLVQQKRIEESKGKQLIQRFSKGKRRKVENESNGLSTPTTAEATDDDNVLVVSPPVVYAPSKNGKVKPKVIIPEDACDACCLDHEVEHTDAVVFCDGCNLRVHQTCYGIPKIPKGPWYCAQCEAGVKNMKCCVCPNTDDHALKPTTDGRWIHVMCAMWHSEPRFVDPETRTPVDLSLPISPARMRLTCVFCKKKGACLQCQYGRCATSYHVPCGFRNGIKFEFRDAENEEDVYFHSFCLKHAPLSDHVKSNNSNPRLRPGSGKKHTGSRSNISSRGAKRAKRSSSAHEERKTATDRSLPEGDSTGKLSRRHSSVMGTADGLSLEKRHLHSKRYVILPTKLDDTQLPSSAFR